MVGGRSNYTEDAVAAARSVLLELVRLLGQYRDEIVVIGGWVPELLLAGGAIRHVGSIDVDLALDHRRLQDAGYRTIQQLLLSHGYRQGSQPFIFFRSVPVGGRDIEVEVDLLAGEYKGTGRSRRHQRVQDLHLRKARGCDLAFEMFTDVLVEGSLPGGARDKGPRPRRISRTVLRDEGDGPSRPGEDQGRLGPLLLPAALPGRS